MSEHVLTVVYTGEPDEVFEFASEGQGRFFGRDDEMCEIVIWSALNGTALSRLAGRIWRMDGELWLRNLSTVHELVVTTGDGPPDPPLPPRRDDNDDPGPARSLPAPRAIITGPDGCELLVRQEPSGSYDIPLNAVMEVTIGVPPIPADLRPVAAALCEPLLAGGQLPATYSDIARRLNTGSLKRARTLVGRLSELYRAEVPMLTPELPDEAGVSADANVRSALGLPDYYEIAHLLVRRRLVTITDVEALAAVPP
jgi:hypothetical protein